MKQHEKITFKHRLNYPHNFNKFSYHEHWWTIYLESNFKEGITNVKIEIVANPFAIKSNGFYYTAILKWNWYGNLCTRNYGVSNVANSMKYILVELKKDIPNIVKFPRFSQNTNNPSRND